MPRRTNGVVLYTSLTQWEPLLVEGAQGYAWIKTLSKDGETGARTALVKYDPGFEAQATAARWATDAYTLDGEMRSGDHYLSVRSGWTADPARAAEWQAIQDDAAVRLPAHVAFEE